jgi:hypothetical protein
MTPVIRIDDEVMDRLKKKAIELGLVFESPNAVLKKILGIDSDTSTQYQIDAIPNGDKAMPRKAATLIISTPWYKKDETGKSTGKPGEPNSFETYMQTGLGKGYAISKKDASKLVEGSTRVVILRNDLNKRRAEGILVRLIKTDRKTPQGILRYDIQFKDQKEVDYTYVKPVEKVDRHGVKVIDSN